MTKDKDRTVWSSNQGDVRKQRDALRKVISLPPEQQVVYLHRDSKSRGGSPVSVLKNLTLSDEDMKSLAKRLKQLCGSGGTVKNGTIEIQGEQREKIAEELKRLGYKVKIAGG